MPRKKDVDKGGAPIARIRENSRLMRTHENMVDLISGRHSSNSILDVFVSGLLGLDLLRNFEGELEDDLIYSDDDDDEDNDRISSRYTAHRQLEPHPRIKQLTDEEADKHAKELIEQEERRKEKTEKNKRKKLRKKEKKRLVKENAVKDNLPEEEQGKSDSENPQENQQENQQENPVIENNADANDSPESGKTPNGTEAAECDETCGNNEEENLAEIDKEEDGEPKELDLNNSYASTTKSVPEEMCNQKPAREKKKKKTKLLEIQPPKEEMPKVVEKPEIQKKKEEKHEPNKEKSMDHAAEEFAKRSGELAAIGNRLAASEQYEMAVKCFTDAIKFNPKEFKLFGNRSLCYERLQQYENALRDADVALSMEPNWIKGLFRKGKALCGLKRYYEASLIYREVLRLESSSVEAMQELKRAQTLHLMEMGFSWAQSSEALKTHSTLEEAVEALFDSERNPGPADAAACWDITHQSVVQEEDEDEGQWTVRQTTRPRMQQVRELDAFGHRRSDSQSPTPHSRNGVKPELFSIWVGTLAPAVTYTTLHELFSRAGTVYSIKMLLEQQCAFVNYTRKEDCDRAIQCINGMVVEGAPLSVRYPNKFHNGLCMPRPAANDPCPTRVGAFKKECFFWRTTGCTRQDCTFRHVPEHKNIDKDKFTSRLGHVNM
ncbi:RNA polymerase II-associated protein 3 isoform X2 [Centropristis striata]|uniref:RNA polymerase II-associated protein 3 isoform X2 n=1 Tax=Centropristis striata TaxID=184440 RepID=UPI0027E03144|nr:RNA polymerase II-associated protein 3 isoform X2 [Centropristis striata]